MPRKCKNSPNLFCYVCGSFTVKTHRRAITSDVKRIYQLYFGCPLGDQDKQWAPHQICTSCSRGLRNWLNKQISTMLFAVPMIWRKLKDHIQDCYFCLVNVQRFSRKHRMKISYPNLDLARRPVPLDASMPAPLPPKTGVDTLVDEIEEDSDEESIPASKDSTDSEYDPEKSSKQSYKRPSIFKTKGRAACVKITKKTTCFMQMLWLPITESVTWACRQYSE